MTNDDASIIVTNYYILEAQSDNIRNIDKNNNFGFSVLTSAVANAKFKLVTNFKQKLCHPSLRLVLRTGSN